MSGDVGAIYRNVSVSDPDNLKRILQVMPWPTYRNMSDHDLRAVYEYLRAIPSRGKHEAVAAR